MQHVFRSLGVENLDARAGRQVHATPWMAGTYADLEEAQTIVVVGQPPSQTAPVLDLRIRKAVARRGATLIAAGPFATGSFVGETHAASVAAIDDASLASERIAFVWDGIDLAEGASAFALSRALAETGKHVTTFVAGEQPNARGAEAMGMRPRGAGLTTPEILAAAKAGSLGVLALAGVNPVLRHADADLARAALEAVPFVVATELFLTESASLAHLVLPAKSALEKSGHTTDLQGAVQIVAGHLAAPGEALADGEFLIALAEELGIEIPSPDELERLATDAARSSALAAGPRRPRRRRTRADRRRGRARRRDRGASVRRRRNGPLRRSTPRTARASDRRALPGLGGCGRRARRRSRRPEYRVRHARESDRPARCRSAGRHGARLRRHPRGGGEPGARRRSGDARDPHGARARRRRHRGSWMTLAQTSPVLASIFDSALATIDAAPLWLIVIIKSAILLVIVLTTFAYSMIFERKIMAWMQLRPGPNRTGPWGLMQPAADAVKMLFKEDLTPDTADPIIYRFAPWISLFSAMAAYAVLPFSETTTPGGGIWGIGDVNAGILFIFALTSIGVYGISLAGWSSGSKYPLLGSVRSTAQMISYELAMTMSVVGVIVLAGTTSLAGIVHQQQSLWFLIPQFFGFVIYLVTAVAETNRAPFDLVRGRDGAGRRFPHRVLRLALRPVLHRRIPQHDHGVVHCDAALPRRMGSAVRTDVRAGADLVSREGRALSVHVHLATHDAPASALRPPDEFWLEDAAAGRDAQSDGDGRDRRMERLT